MPKDCTAPRPDFEGIAHLLATGDKKSLADFCPQEEMTQMCRCKLSLGFSFVLREFEALSKCSTVNLLSNFLGRCQVRDCWWLFHAQSLIAVALRTPPTEAETVPSSMERYNGQPPWRCGISHSVQISTQHGLA